MAENRKGPVYTGMRKHKDAEAGFSLWLPSDWHRTDMGGEHHGVIYSPYPNDLNTCFAAEKKVLAYKVTKEDVPTLKNGFEKALNELPGVEIEKTDVVATSTLIIFEAKFTFLEGEQRRKRWLRNVYWGEGQLILIAQGSTPEEYDYWLPMFFNTMTTVEI
jgi:hypothetical protein